MSSAITRFIRSVTQTEESFQSDPSEAPVSLPIPKLRSVEQTSGEAVYVGDLPTPPGTLYAAFVIAKNGNADIGSIDTSQAMAIPGVKTFLSASDIPGQNNIVGNPLFASGSVSYSGQGIGVIIADSEENANLGAGAVVVNFTNQRPLILSTTDAIAANSFFPITVPSVTLGDINTGLKESDFIIQGTVTQGGQYHFHMETHTVLVVPKENNSVHIYAACQYSSFLQSTVASVLQIPQNKVIVETKRCGGGYGGKIINVLFPVVAAAISAFKLGVPIKLIMPIETNMQMVGRRPDHTCQYTVGITKDGFIKALHAKVYTNAGIVPVGASFFLPALLKMIDSCYSIPNFLAEGKLCMTNNPMTTAMRGPGWVPAIFFMEHIIEHVASYIGADSELIKRQNFFTVNQITPDGTKLVYWNMDKIWTQLKAASNYDQRVQEIATYNQQNKWTKRGISIVPVRFGVDWANNHQSAEVCIYGDGSVLVSHSGVEIGQGIDTKVAQIVAYGLGCPLEYVDVGPHTNIMAANAGPTGGSVTSALAGKAAYEAAQILAQRLQPIRKLVNAADWPSLIASAFKLGVDLVARGNVIPPEGPNSTTWQYQSYSACVQEVWLDVLTGEYQLLRSDILFDAGTSLNPAIDLGQIEGGFVTGLGLYTTEQITYDNSGILFNTSTWEYKPPTAMDIPLDVRVTLLANSPNPIGFLSSKCTGEPPVCLGSSVLFALQHAVAEARKDQNLDVKDFFLNAPASVDNVLLSEQLNYGNFSF